MVEYLRRGLNDMVHDADAAVVGTIKAISEPKWNTATGRPPADPDSAPVLPRLYRAVTLLVERVLWQSPTLDVHPRTLVDVFTFGDGTATGGYVVGDPGNEEYVRENNISGPLKVGGRNVMLLEWQTDLSFSDDGKLRRRPSVTITDGFMGNWTIEGDRAVSALPWRVVSYERLVAKLQQERRSPPRPNDRRGIDNPLE